MAVSRKHITVAARIDRLPLFSLHRKLALVLGLGTFFDLYDIFLGGILAPVLTKAFALNSFETALVIGSGFFGMFVGAIILGVISDYIGRRTMYMIDLLVYSFFTLLAAFSPNFALFIVCRFLAGLGLGATPPITDIYLGEMALAARPWSARRVDCLVRASWPARVAALVRDPQPPGRR